MHGATRSLFNRGITQPWLFPGVEQRRGNRYPEIDKGLGSLATGVWDAAIDLPAYFPRIVDASTQALRERVGQYVVMSTIGVYRDFSKVDIKEDAPVRVLERPFVERPDLSEDYEYGTYGARKVECERIVFERFSGAATAIRAGGIIGGGLSDPSKWYWPAKLRRDARVVAAGDGQDPTQWIDRRDIADFILRAVEHKLTGVYNVVGKQAMFSDVLNTVSQVVGSSARIAWAGDGRREALSRTPGPPSRHRLPGLGSIDDSRARDAGLVNRPLAESIAADWLYFRSHHPLSFDFLKAGYGLSASEEDRIFAEST